MKALLKFELIGEAVSERMKSRYQDYKGNDKSKSWVARLTGLDPEYGFKRTFLRGKRDYSKANSVGSRGIWVYFPLDPGLYEVNERKTWKSVDRYFLRVNDNGIYERIERDEVIRCLSRASATSE